jgi:N6-L-threonylcarbamoyladenine synthase
LASGGHTSLYLAEDFGKYTHLGSTRDDAAGEAFDKVAKLLGLGYPGGPIIDRLAKEGDANAIHFPRAALSGPGFNFSFSGLKTAVRQAWETQKVRREDLAACLQVAVVEVLVEKTLAAAKKYAVKGVCVVGGVSANEKLRHDLGERMVTELPGVAYLPSDRAYITDNAAMIAAAGYWRFVRQDFVDWKRIDVRPEWELDRRTQHAKRYA